MDQKTQEHSEKIDLARQQLAAALSTFRVDASPRDEALAITLEGVDRLLEQVQGDLQVAAIQSPEHGLTPHRIKLLQKDYTAYQVLVFCAQNSDKGGQGLTQDNLAFKIGIAHSVVQRAVISLCETPMLNCQKGTPPWIYTITEFGRTILQSRTLFKDLEPVSPEQVKTLFTGKDVTRKIILRQIDQLTSSSRSSGWVEAETLMQATDLSFSQLTHHCAKLRQFGLIDSIGVTEGERRYRLTEFWKNSPEFSMLRWGH